jgi:hypothetical protein
MTDRPANDDLVRDAARAARQAADEAVTPEARFFLKRHAELLERIAAARRVRDGLSPRHGRLAFAMPLLAQALLG